MSHKFCKSQMFSSDFLIACSIFLLFLVIVMVYWSYTEMQIEETKNINDMVDKAYTISQVWFREGTPEYWNSTNVREMGLLSDHRINETKMNYMKNMNYNTVRGIIGATPYEFHFNVSLVDNTGYSFVFGNYPNQAINVIKIKRSGILNSSIAIIEVLLWQ